MFNAMIETLKANPRKIVFTEGHDARILEATARLVEGGFLTPILIGNVEEVKANAAKGGFNIEGVEIIDPLTYEGMDEMVQTMFDLRKGKMPVEECRAALSKGNYFGTMLVKMGKADSLLGGATYSTAAPTSYSSPSGSEVTGVSTVHPISAAYPSSSSDISGRFSSSIYTALPAISSTSSMEQMSVRRTRALVLPLFVNDSI